MSSLFDYLDNAPNVAETANKTVNETANETVSELEPVLLIPQPITVSLLTLQIKGVVDELFADVWVVGEVSNLTRPRSGHIYFTLKDDGAQLPAVAWKSTASKVGFDIYDGMQLVCRGRLDVYPPHGKYQMIVTQLQPQGIGLLELAFRQLRTKLEAAGFFDPAKKRPLPKVVRCVAVITSPTGAAMRDFLQVLGRRTKRVDVRIIPVKVQGEGAAEEIAAAIKLVNRTKLADCIVVTRGGGSLEDLWAFNEEVLVRAVAASEIPIISAVGHEIDVSLCDLAADLRALTPSEAAERIAPEDSQLEQLLVQFKQRFENLVEKKLRLAQERFRAVEKNTIFLRPTRIVEDRTKTVDYFEQNLDNSINRKLETSKNSFGKLAATLEALSPLAVFKRGYSITQTQNGEIIRSAETVKTGDTILTRLADGVLASIVQ